jgi:DNA mismatch repair protein MutS
MKNIANMKLLTPVMRQYVEIKEQYSDSILFFRMGDFYEMFFDDAKLASRMLGIALTSRDKERDIPMCGVPFHSAKNYIARLVKEGYKVALCEQVEDPAQAKGIVERAVIRVITPGIALDEDLLDSKSNNFIAAASWNSNSAGIAYMDVTTGEFEMTDLKGLAILYDEIKRINPSELLLQDPPRPGPSRPSFSGTDTSGRDVPGRDPLEEIPVKNITFLGNYDFQYRVAVERLTKHFDVTSLDGFGLGGIKEGVRAAGALLYYVKQTQKADLSHVRKCTPYYPHRYLVMDDSTRRNLELMQNIRTGDGSGTLLELLDRTNTAMGGRRLRAWLTYPLVEAVEIKRRLEAVGELKDDRQGRMDIEEALSGVYDLERLIGRVSLKVAGPRDLVSLKVSLKRIPPLKEILKKFKAPMTEEIGSSLDGAEEAVSLIEASITDSPPATTREGGIIKGGFSKGLDELRDIGSGGKDWIARLESAERARSGINTLKVGYNKVFGYYIEVTNANLPLVPSDYIRKQTLVNAERFITPALKEWESKILTAEEKAQELELKLFSRVRDEVARSTERVQATASKVATIDVLTAFARVSEDRNYVRPEITGGDAIAIEQGRHPVVESMSPEPFIPNDLRLDCTEDQIIVLTGPNMAGKSTYIRQVALIVVMVQTGCFVPAAKASIGVVDRIFTRVGASDDLSKGQSTFMLEMNEAANILNNATSKSLVILDEIGRGTSTFDGLSIAWAVAEYLHDTPGARAKTLFATHYHELTDLSLTKERVKNYNMAVKEWNDRVIFLRKVLPGGTNRSYGIHVARLAGMPPEVIERAMEILKNLERGELNDAGMPRLATRLTQVSGPISGEDRGMGQRNLPNLLGGDRDPIYDELRQLDPEGITPIEALNILNKMKGMLKD